MSIRTLVVLVVEDEPLIRLDAVEVITEAGYEVIEACDADEAIVLLEAHPEICVVFTDVEMPGSMNGARLAACVRDRWPPVEIIVTSGRVPAADIFLPARSIFLAKPYIPGQLAGHLDRMAA